MRAWFFMIRFWFANTCFSDMSLLQSCDER
jgi:hypothetical protein